MSTEYASFLFLLSLFCFLTLLNFHNYYFGLYIEGLYFFATISHLHDPQSNSSVMLDNDQYSISCLTSCCFTYFVGGAFLNYWYVGWSVFVLQECVLVFDILALLFCIMCQIYLITDWEFCFFYFFCLQDRAIHKYRYLRMCNGDLLLYSGVPWVCHLWLSICFRLISFCLSICTAYSHQWSISFIKKPLKNTLLKKSTNRV